MAPYFYIAEWTGKRWIMIMGDHNLFRLIRRWSEFTASNDLRWIDSFALYKKVGKDHTQMRILNSEE